MKLTIFKRLAIGYTVIMGLISFMGIYVTLKLNEINQLTRDIATVDLEMIEVIEELSDHIFSQVGFDRKYLITADPDFYNQFWKIRELFTEDMERLQTLLVSDDDKKLFKRIKGQYQKYLTLFNQQVNYKQKNQDLTLWANRAEKEKLMDTINQELKVMVKKARSARDRKIKLSNQISSHILRVTSGIIGFAIILGLAISFFNTRSINRSILLLKEKTKDIAECKYTRISNINSPPEIKELADDFNMMSERLKELDELKEDFINRISHELRTPLTAMREASSMLLEGAYADAPDKQKQLHRITKDECERLIHSVNRILDLSRMEANMMDFKYKKRDLIPIIQKTILKLAPIARKKKIGLELRPTDELPSVWIDEERLAQVLENLLGNALKFTESQGRVRVYAILRNEKKKFLQVSISDTGCGISRENLATIFDKFKRVDNGTKLVRGTGLGLSIVKHIVSNHGGKIWAKSQPGKGSIFSFTLPVL